MKKDKKQKMKGLILLSDFISHKWGILKKQYV